MKETGKLLIKELIVIAVCAFFGVAALAITYLLPNDAMYENVKESSIILHNEGVGAHIWENITETMLDVQTDGLVLNVSFTATDDGVRDIILDTYVEVDGTNPMNSLYETVALSNDNYLLIDYGRYWHGYQIIIRPLLCFFTYSDIRQINMILQLALVFIFVYTLAKSKDRALIIPFFGMYIFLSPVSLFSSLQYSPCFYIMMFALIALFILRRYLNDTTRNYLFLLAGIATAYFDFLTYPLVTLGIPLIAYLGSDYENLIIAKNRKGVKNIFFYTASWGIGYLGMWSSKWIIASILTGENIIYDAVEQIKFRSGYFTAKHTYFDTLRLNLEVINAKVLLIAVICLIAYIVIILFTLKNKQHFNMGRSMLPYVGMLLFVSIYPFIWYLLTKDHSCNHAYFTYRELAISVFGFLMIGAIYIKGIEY